jgi:hypothetical protein
MCVEVVEGEGLVRANLVSDFVTTQLKPPRSRKPPSRGGFAEQIRSGKINYSPQ